MKRLPLSISSRSLQRSPIAAAIAAGLFSLAPNPLAAATITVGSNGCTLANAIRNANTNFDGDGAAGCRAGTLSFGADTIVLPMSSVISLSNPLPDIESPILIRGQGAAVLRNPIAANFRIFTVTSLGKLTLDRTSISGGVANNESPECGGGGVAVYGGQLTLTDSTVSGNTSNLNGGGVCTLNGTLNISNSSVSYNSATIYGGGVFSGVGQFGGTGATQIINSIIAGNRGRYGGGVANALVGTLSLTNSTVSGNMASGNGGGVSNTANGTLDISRSTVSGNSAPYGGGAVNYAYGAMTLTNSTVSGNRSAASGGGIINSVESELRLTDSTVSGNTAGTEGGGVANYGLATLHRSLFSGNASVGAGREMFNSQVPGYIGVVASYGFNLFGFSANAGISGFTPAASDVVPIAGLAAILRPLADNGGPTRTHELVAGGPAIDAAGTACSATDQRGIARPQGAACDIGAVELEPPPLQLPALSVHDGLTVEGTPGRSGPRRMRLYVTLSTRSRDPVSVDYATSDGTATTGLDYVAKTGTLVIPAHTKLASILVDVIPDDVREPNETFRVTLSNPVGATIADGEALGTIRNDD